MNLMATKLYVGNLAYSTTSQSPGRTCSASTAKSAWREVIMDRDTGQSKGFCFVEMSNDQGARTAIAALDGRDEEQAVASRCNEGRLARTVERRRRPPRGGRY